MASRQPAEERQVEKDGYEFTYYPGFCSRATVRAANGKQHDLFAQTQTFHLPKDEKLPATRHKLRLKGGPNGQDVTLHVEDPKLRIAKITIELYGEDRQSHSPHDGKPSESETVEIQNWSKVCPPECAE
jgi:hypothetical protein